MKKHWQKLLEKCAFGFIFVFACACQGTGIITTPSIKSDSIQPTFTTAPHATVKPTSGPLFMTITELEQNCSALDQHNVTIQLQGRIFIPEENVFGYTLENETWLGMNLTTDKQVVVLFRVGTDANSMDQFPEFFTEKDLIIRSFDNKIIRQGHLVLITGRPKYRADSKNRKCEVFVEQVETLMSPAVLVPVDRTVQEMIDGDTNDECPPELKNPSLEQQTQFVRLRGALNVDDYNTVCTLKSCVVLFSDKTGTMNARLVKGEGPNAMLALPEKITRNALVVFDKKGVQVDFHELTLIGLIRGTSSTCEIIVYEIE